MPMNQKNLTDKLRQLLQRNRLTLLAFAIPAIILLISYMSRGIFPVGNRNVLTIDLYHQYAPFIAELRAKFVSGGSLFYSWAGGLGTNFWALYAYYLASPINILLVLFPPAYVTEAILLITLIKIGLCGAFFFIYLRGVWRQENLQMVAISLFYALSAYSLAYSWDIMWLDGIFMLPLIMLGLVKLVREKRCLLYCLSLGYILYSNYYIAYFIILFTILYFPIVLFQYQGFSRPRQLLATVGRFGAFSLLGAGLSSILMVPTYFSLQLTSAADDAFPATIMHYFDLFDYIGQHFMLVTPTIRSGMPNMYCGILALLLIPVYFFARSIGVKQKLMHLGLILVMILSFNINVLNFIWHGFHYPNQLPYRNSFVYIFLILSIAYPALRSLGEFTGKQLGAIAASAVGCVLLAQKLNDTAVELQTVYVTIIFIVIYAAILTMERVRKMRKADIALALMIVVVAELTLNTLLTVHRIDTTEYYSTREGYLDGVEVADIRQAVSDIAKDEGQSFYRMECIPPKTINDGFMYGYRGLSIFASTMAERPVKTFENLGFHSNSINSYKYESQTVVLDSLFGIKYLIRRSGNAVDQIRESIIKTSNIDVYKNPYALSIGYVGLPALADWYSSSGDPFTAQNKLVTALTGSEDALVELKRETGDLGNMTISNTTTHYYSYTRTNTNQESSAKVNILVEQDQQVYLYFQTTANKADRGYIMVGETRVDFNAKRSTIVDVGYVKVGTPVELNIFYDSKSSQTGMFELYAYALDEDTFAQAISQLRSQSLQVTRFTDTRVEGTVTAANDGVFLLTIPYDEGWSVELDGQPVTVTALDGCFISFDITAGTHAVRLKYTPPWLLVGLLISLGSLIVLLMIYLIPGGSRKKAGKASQPEIRQVVLPETGLTESDETETDEEDGPEKGQL
jgi:uncharacterized membrane protein YfhO